MDDSCRRLMNRQLPVQAGFGRQLAGQSFGLGDLQRGEHRRAAGAFAVRQLGQAVLGEPAPPGRTVSRCGRVSRVMRALDRPRAACSTTCAHPQPVLGFVAADHLLQPFAIGGTQDYRRARATGKAGRQAG
ncbi:hypothetical protein ACVWZD_006759 [Streptomyces sp. TE3672]